MLLREATPLARLTLPHRMADPATLASVWDDFTPAVPLSVAGAASAGTGFLGGWAGFGILAALISMPFRRVKSQPATKKRQSPTIKADPPVTRPTLVAQTPTNTPRLAGVQR
jgi:hypothetical protein